MTKISQDINYPSILFPKNFHTSMADDMESRRQEYEKKLNTAMTMGDKKEIHRIIREWIRKKALYEV
jgi:undecaprenyl pyrophosphate synthase